MTQVMIYNLGGSQVLGHVSLKHAIGMLYRKVARVHTSVEGEVFGPYERPAAVELLNYVYTKWMYERTGRVVYSRTALLRRDRHRCAYCGKRATTVDHIRPRSHGGPPRGSTASQHASSATRRRMTAHQARPECRCGSPHSCLPSLRSVRAGEPSGHGRDGGGATHFAPTTVLVAHARYARPDNQGGGHRLKSRQGGPRPDDGEASRALA